MSAEQSPFSDHCSNEFEVVSSIHNIIARTDGVYIVKIRGKEEGPVEPKYQPLSVRLYRGLDAIIVQCSNPKRVGRGEADAAFC